MSDVVAILCSDLHLSHTAPIARSAEPDWYAAMERPLKELSDLQNKHDVPVLIAGDIFDRWNAPPSLINFALDCLPNDCFAIPGQHDLPMHRYEDIKRSAYWTLVKAFKIKNVNCLVLDDLIVYGYPWGARPTKVDHTVKDKMYVAMCHTYVWIESHKYPTADDVGHANMYSDRLASFDVALFGDNHKGFTAKLESGCTLFNAGGFMRRKADEVEYKPQVGLLKSDGRVSSHFLSTKQDKFAERHLAMLVENTEVNMEKFLRDLELLNGKNVDFNDALKQAIAKSDVSKSVKEILVKVLEGMSE